MHVYSEPRNCQAKKWILKPLFKVAKARVSARIVSIVFHMMDAELIRATRKDSATRDSRGAQNRGTESSSGETYIARLPGEFCRFVNVEYASLSKAVSSESEQTAEPRCHPAEESFDAMEGDEPLETEHGDVFSPGYSLFAYGKESRGTLRGQNQPVRISETDSLESLPSTQSGSFSRVAYSDSGLDEPNSAAENRGNASPVRLETSPRATERMMENSESRVVRARFFQLREDSKSAESPAKHKSFAVVASKNTQRTGEETLPASAVNWPNEDVTPGRDQKILLPSEENVYSGDYSVFTKLAFIGHAEMPRKPLPSAQLVKVSSRTEDPLRKVVCPGIEEAADRSDSVPEAHDDDPKVSAEGDRRDGGGNPNQKLPEEKQGLQLLRENVLLSNGKQFRVVGHQNVMTENPEKAETSNEVPLDARVSATEEHEAGESEIFSKSGSAKQDDAGKYYFVTSQRNVAEETGATSTSPVIGAVDDDDDDGGWEPIRASRKLRPSSPGMPFCVVAQVETNCGPEHSDMFVMPTKSALSDQKRGRRPPERVNSWGLKPRTAGDDIDPSEESQPDFLRERESGPPVEAGNPFLDQQAVTQGEPMRRDGNKVDSISKRDTSVRDKTPALPIDCRLPAHLDFTKEERDPKSDSDHALRDRNLTEDSGSENIPRTERGIIKGDVDECSSQDNSLRDEEKAHELPKLSEDPHCVTEVSLRGKIADTTKRDTESIVSSQDALAEEDAHSWPQRYALRGKNDQEESSDLDIPSRRYDVTELDVTLRSRRGDTLRDKNPIDSTHVKTMNTGTADAPPGLESEGDMEPWSRQGGALRDRTVTSDEGRVVGGLASPGQADVTESAAGLDLLPRESLGSSGYPEVLVGSFDEDPTIFHSIEEDLCLFPRTDGWTDKNLTREGQTSINCPLKRESLKNLAPERQSSVNCPFEREIFKNVASRAESIQTPHSNQTPETKSLAGESSPLPDKELDGGTHFRHENECNRGDGLPLRYEPAGIESEEVSEVFCQISDVTEVGSDASLAHAPDCVSPPRSDVEEIEQWAHVAVTHVNQKLGEVPSPNQERECQVEDLSGELSSSVTKTSECQTEPTKPPDQDRECQVEDLSGELSNSVTKTSECQTEPTKPPDQDRECQVEDLSGELGNSVTKTSECQTEPTKPPNQERECQVEDLSGELSSSVTKTSECQTEPTKPPDQDRECQVEDLSGELSNSVTKTSECQTEPAKPPNQDRECQVEDLSNELSSSVTESNESQTEPTKPPDEDRECQVNDLSNELSSSVTETSGCQTVPTETPDQDRECQVEDLSNELSSSMTETMECQTDGAVLPICDVECQADLSLELCKLTTRTTDSQTENGSDIVVPGVQCHVDTLIEVKCQPKVEDFHEVDLVSGVESKARLEPLGFVSVRTVADGLCAAGKDVGCQTPEISLETKTSQTALETAASEAGPDSMAGSLQGIRTNTGLGKAEMEDFGCQFGDSTFDPEKPEVDTANYNRLQLGRDTGCDAQSQTDLSGPQTPPEVTLDQEFDTAIHNMLPQSRDTECDAQSQTDLSEPQTPPGETFTQPGGNSDRRTISTTKFSLSSEMSIPEEYEVYEVFSPTHSDEMSAAASDRRLSPIGQSPRVESFASVETWPGTSVSAQAVASQQGEKPGHVDQECQVSLCGCQLESDDKTEGYLNIRNIFNHSKDRSPSKQTAHYHHGNTNGQKKAPATAESFSQSGLLLRLTTTSMSNLFAGSRRPSSVVPCNSFYR